MTGRPAPAVDPAVLTRARAMIAARLSPELRPAAPEPVRNNRGSVRVYAGSLTELRGLPVIGLDDCECSACERLELWDEARRAKVRLIPAGWTPGDRFVTLEHARFESLVDPTAVSS